MVFISGWPLLREAKVSVFKNRRAETITQCVITNIYSTCQLITRDRSGSRVEVCERLRFGIFLQRQFIAERLISCEFFLSAIFPVSTLKKEP